MLPKLRRAFREPSAGIAGLFNLLQLGADLTLKRAVCTTWGRGHFKTFDNFMFDFYKTCNYIFVSECRDPFPDFSVQLRRANSGDIKRLLIQLYGTTVMVKAGRIRVNGQQNIQLPYNANGINMKPFGNLVRLSAKQQGLDVIVVWNSEDYLMWTRQTPGSGTTDNLLEEISGPGSICWRGEEPSTFWVGDPARHVFSLRPRGSPRFPTRTEAAQVRGLIGRCKRSLVQVELGDKYRNKTCGLCGDFNKSPKYNEFLQEAPRQCPTNQVYLESGSPCSPTCSNLRSTCDSHGTYGCFCPEGTVLDDVSGKDMCVHLAECPCTWNGDVYGPGEKISALCRDCVCSMGQWLCTTLPCPGRCSVEGGSFVTTFDSRQYRFHSVCSLVLVKSPVIPGNGHIEAQFEKCGVKPTETSLSAVTFTNRKLNMEISKHDMITVNNEIKRLPFKTENITIYRQSSTYVQVSTLFGLEVQVQVAPVFQVQVNIGNEFYGTNTGLCGNFNGDPKDDFWSSMAVLERTAAPFVNSWQVDHLCEPAVNTGPCTSLSTNCSQRAAQREPPGFTPPRRTRALPRVSRPRIRPAQQILRGDYLHQGNRPPGHDVKCLFEMCNYARTPDFLCAALGLYARACAAKGLLLDGWRNTVQGCSKYSQGHGAPPGENLPPWSGGVGIHRDPAAWVRNWLARGGQQMERVLPGGVDCLSPGLQRVWCVSGEVGVTLRAPGEDVGAHWSPGEKERFHTVFSYDARACDRTCVSLSDRDFECTAIDVPVDGCICPLQTYLDVHRNCVEASKCQCLLSNGDLVGPEESTTIDHEICECPNPYENPKIHRLTLIRTCFFPGTCELPKLYFSCAHGPRGQYGTTCAPTCQMIATQISCTPSECVSGCICPEGMVLDYNEQCIFPEDCPCKFSDRIYTRGDKMMRDCEECTCLAGRWKCTENVHCPATCVIHGEGHVTTFDGKKFIFSGNCEYSLVQDSCCANETHPNFKIVSENVICGQSGVTCSRAIKIYIGDILIEMTDGAYVVTPETAADKFSIRTNPLYLSFEAVTPGGHLLQILWDKTTNAFIRFTRTRQLSLCGLCGNFNGDIGDDFITRSQYLASNALEFANSWKEEPLCRDVTEVVHPCDVNPYHRSWAEQQCEIIHSDVFKPCHNLVYRVPYYESCVQTTCGCEIFGDCECLCGAVLVYAKACLDAGVCINWRSSAFCSVYCDYYNTHPARSNNSELAEAGGHPSHYQPCLCPDSLWAFPNNNMEGCYRCAVSEYYDPSVKLCVSCDSPPSASPSRDELRGEQQGHSFPSALPLPRGDLGRAIGCPGDHPRGVVHGPSPLPPSPGGRELRET
ncbi:mucin-6-like [Pristis pectinata]|uniref:mucin-6-like n=1 Tax=Pristis pectinata TaxID=685728 RepID=UPI00223D645D|nr:mucin-6-like [Pristis pectinata]